MTKDEKIKKLAELAHRTHLYCEDTRYACRAHPEVLEYDPTGVCTCGADEHNTKVNKILCS